MPIHDIGTAIYLSPDVFGWAAEWGWSNPFAFYFAGRGGMLGDVGPDVVTSALGWFEPNAVKAMYSEGIGVAGARDAAARMAEAHAKWGRKHYGDVEGLDDIVAVTEELVDGLEGSAIPLFVGWRNAASVRNAGRAGSPTHADPPGMARRAPPRRHHGRRSLAARGDPDQRRPGSGEVLRVVRALRRTSPPSRRSMTKRRRSPTASARRRWPRRWTAPSTPPSSPGFGPSARPRRSAPGARAGRDPDGLQ